MKKITLALSCLVLSSVSFAGTAMKYEGSCSGTLVDETPVNFTYYSNFNGCTNSSRAAISFNSGPEMGLYTGKRSFVGESDVYSFTVRENGKRHERVRVKFADSTGNMSAVLKYHDPEDDKYKSVTVQCEVRDYEYADC